MGQDIIKNIPLTLDINARKRLDGTVDVRLYSRDIATGQFEFTLVDENNNPIELDETYSAQALVKYKDEEKTYLDDMVVEGNIIRFIFPHDFIIKDGVVTIYIYITKDNYTSDVAALSFNVYRSEIDDIATDIVAVYDKNYEDILTEFEQALVDYKLTLPKADSVRADIDAILNSFSEDSQTKLNQFDIDAQLAIADLEQRVGPQGEQGPKGDPGVGIPQTISKSGDTVTLSDMGGSISLADYAKASQVLTDVPANAKFTDTIYSHPSTHPASIITETSTKRFVTDDEKSTWNAKQDTIIAGTNLTKSGNTLNATDTKYSNATTTVSGLMASTDKAKLDGIANGAQVNRTIATQSEAESGINNTTDMTPLRTKQAITKQSMIVVNHGTNASTERPADALAVYWIGAVEPTNATDNDLWIGG